MIDIKHVSFAYDGDHEVLKDVSLSFSKGKYITIIGHNGSGKSTLAKLLAGLLTLKKGTIMYEGVSLTAETLLTLRKKIGIVFQNPDNQFIGSTVADDIAFGLENREVPHEDMQEKINYFSKEVGMEKFLDREPINLSGGQKQRVAIAGVLAMAPEVMIFDEATAMLDPQGKKEIRDLIVSMRQAQPSLTLISITHDLEEASISDEVIVLNEGQLYAQGTPNEVFKHPSLLKNIRLDVPFVHQVKAGLELNDQDIETFDDLVKALCQ
jgi:energy-coupling factor transport system ATP-binding protein